MWDDLGEYIVNLYKCKSSKSNFKIVEVGAGRFFGVSDYIKGQDNQNLDINIILTDIDPINENITFDDIIKPDKKLYSGADVIYSIRPPYEIQKYINDLAREIGAILIIKPLFNEDLNLSIDMKLVNYKKATFYQSTNNKHETDNL